jgi:diacylglycerol kinase (ATP)
VKPLFLVNARSGTARRYDVGSLVREHGAVQLCERKEDLDAILADAERDGCDVVYAVGGDGTVHEIAKRLVGRGMALGILPIGSGNGFARHIGLPMDTRAALGACSRQRIATIDTGEVNGIPFLGVMGLGFDAWIADRFAAAGTRGFATYLRVGLREFARYRDQDYELVIDGNSMHRKAKVLTVANASQYGNDARIAPRASVQDGVLDVVAIHDVSLLSAIPLAVRLFRGTIDRSRRVTTARGGDIVIHRPAAGPAHLDGEPVTLPETLHVRVRPASLKVLLPDSCAAI